MPNVPPEQIQPTSVGDYLEVMSKAVFQSGMSWRVVEAKWSGIREAFAGFDAGTVADMTEPELDALAEDTRVIRNRRKLGAIVTNAQRMIALDKEHGGFQNYLRAHDSFDATLKAIRKDFKYMGPSGIYYFLYVVSEPVIPYEEYKAQYG